MHSLLLALAAVATPSFAASIGSNHHHHSKRSYTSPNPIQVASSAFLCDVQSDLPVIRDLGYVGKIQDTVIYTYGDTETNTGTFYMTSDSSSIGTGDPCYVLNTQRTSDNQHPTDMIAPESAYGETNTADAFGGTNVVPVGGNSGMMFYLVNHRPVGGDDYIVGAGVAQVILTGQNVSTSRMGKNWWDATAGEPWYGDVGAYTDGNYIWGYGHGGSTHMDVYLTRAPVSGWTDFDNWEYYDGSTDSWSNTRLYNPSSAQAMQWNADEGPVWAVGQGQMIWSPYYQKIVWVYATDFADNSNGVFGVYARTADRPRGPWSSKVELFTVQRAQSDYQVYCAVANPYFDDSGKTLVVTVDNGAATVQATTVNFV